MKTVAFLQNQWFKNPERVAKMYAHEAGPERRAALNRVFLFYRSLTGRRLQSAFNDDVCREIIWEEASKEVCGQSSGSFPADKVHMLAVIEHFEPDVILGFGKITCDSLREMGLYDGMVTPVIYGPHPAARHATVTEELRTMARDLRSMRVVA